MMFTEQDRLVLHNLLHRVAKMSVDVSGVKASAERLEATVVKLVGLVEAALASNTAAADAAVQAALDDVKKGLDTAGDAGDAEVAKATPVAATPAA